MNKTLQPAESMAFTVAKAQILRGDMPGINTTTVLVAALERLQQRDDQIESMIRHGHAMEGWGSRAVMDIWTVMSGGEWDA